MNRLMLPSRRHRGRVFAEPLERRTLMSGTWTTVATDTLDSFMPGMAADKAGNVYTLNGPGGILRKFSGGQWTDVVLGDNVDFNAIATDSAGNVFVAGDNYGADGKLHWQVWEMPAGQNALVLIDTFNGIEATGVATDSAGDVFASGVQYVTTTVRNKMTTTSYGVVRKLAPDGNGGFVATNLYQNRSVSLDAVAIIGNGPSAGIYAVGTGTGVNPNAYWDVIKSFDGGAHWSLVDQYQYDAGQSSMPDAITGDAAGTVYVSGRVLKVTARRGSNVISTTSHWLVRKSVSGSSGTWSNSDDFLPVASSSASANALGVGPAGNVYVAGQYIDASNTRHAVIRTNVGGSWSIIDNYLGGDGGGAEYTAFTTGADGTFYAGGDDYLSCFIRSMPGPATTLSTPPSTSIFSSISIGSPSKSNRIRPVDELFAA